MRKIRKWISILAAALLAAVPFMVTPVTAMAATRTVDFGMNWMYGAEGIIDSGIPFVINVTTDQELGSGELFSLPQYATSDEIKEIFPALADDFPYGKMVAAVMVSFENNFAAGDIVEIPLPFSGTVDLDYGLPETEWSIESPSPTILRLTCLAETDGFLFLLTFDPSEAAPEDQFWFKPMKTQLNIAAEIAATTGKEATAEVSGDFGLSYEIMKWLEDHPNVTLKYTLTYKEKGYNIVIKGGQKLADPSIPWYGPEYLIGKFVK